ncbi:hypothetical protein OUZ56_033230 [Daphnia magna]|uniref:Uncharacterized protein n=1 Tax=Daphnia magna TaxID=35525 RepID=A0ABQ9ZXG2_9CRUS|nr:hypothetical protein OUZ56_033230 [Daphnia magna]
MSTSLAQELAFAEEIYALSKNLKLPLKSSLCTFKPFLEEVRQLRVGGHQLVTQRLLWGHHTRKDCLQNYVNITGYSQDIQ